MYLQLANRQLHYIVREGLSLSYEAHLAFYSPSVQRSISVPGGWYEVIVNCSPDQVLYYFYVLRRLVVY